MMKNVLQKKAILSIVLMMFFTVPVMAQFGETPEDEDEEDTPLDPAPIDDYIVPLLLVGVVTGYYLLRKKKSIA